MSRRVAYNLILYLMYFIGIVWITTPPVRSIGYLLFGIAAVFSLALIWDQDESIAAIIVSVYSFISVILAIGATYIIFAMLVVITPVSFEVCFVGILVMSFSSLAFASAASKHYNKKLKDRQESNKH